MILRTCVIALFFTLCLSGCSTTKSEAWKTQDVSLSNFKTFEILPIINDSGTPINQDIMSFFNNYLKEQFKVQNLHLTDAPQYRNGVLIVKSILLVYGFRINPDPYTTAGPTRINRSRVDKCKILTSLVDKSTGNVIAEISFSKEAGATTSPNFDSREWVFKESATAVAKEVAKMMRSVETDMEKVWEKL